MSAWDLVRARAARQVDRPDPTCAWKGCTASGTHHPVLLAMPAGMPEYTGKPVEMILGILVCAAHQADRTAADFVTDEGWAQIVHGFRAVGRVDPDRPSLGLAWKRPDMLPRAMFTEGRS